MRYSKTNRPVLVKFTGGLGNQLFQYAFARLQAHLNNSSLVYDASIYRSEEARTDRPFLLDKFQITGQESDLALIRQLTPIQTLLKSRYRLFLPLFQTVVGYPIYLESSDDVERILNCYREGWTKKRGAGFVSGFFASYRYPGIISATLRREIRLKDRPSAELERLTQQFITEPSVCVCVRRGDYAKFANFGIIPLSYYERAFRLIRNEFPDIKFRIFSDEPDYAFDLLRPLGAERLDHNLSVHEKFVLMQKCRHFILANSTYGWWAAWLGQGPDSIIVRPDKYYQGTNQDMNNFWPLKWRIVSTVNSSNS